LLAREKAKALATAAATKALAEAKSGKKLAELFPPDAEKTNQFALETKPEAKETGEFNSTVETIPQLGLAPEASKAIFARTEPGVVDQLVTVGDAVAVVQVDERKLTSEADFEKQKTQLRIEAIKGKQYETREAFLKALKQQGTVVTNQKALDKVVGEG
jgi:peptidyl-prolyl cis-trans isomerase D